MISLPHFLLKLQTDVFEPATVCTLLALIRSAKRHPGRDIENQGEIGLETAADGFIQKPHGALAQATTKPLIGKTGIIKAIADHEFTARKGRTHNFLQVLMPGGVHEQEFRHGREFPVG